MPVAPRPVDSIQLRSFLGQSPSLTRWGLFSPCHTLHRQFNALGICHGIHTGLAAFEAAHAAGYLLFAGRLDWHDASSLQEHRVRRLSEVLLRSHGATVAHRASSFSFGYKSPGRLNQYPVSGRGAVRPAIAYVQAIIEFKAAVRSGDTQTVKAKEKERKLREYFDEFFGRKKGKVAAREIDYVSRHGEVVKALREWRKRKGLTAGQRVVKTTLLDLGVSKGSDLVEVYEVKTSAVRGDVYTGIGQLTVHAQSLDCSRTLVLPADEALAQDLAAALMRNGIHLQLYRLTETGVTLL